MAAIIHDPRQLTPAIPATPDLTYNHGMSNAIQRRLRLRLLCHRYRIQPVACLALATTLAACTGPGPSVATAPRSVAAQPVKSAAALPEFVTANYIDLSRIGRISRFRSAAGHDFSDDVEHCRSMKHYYWPNGGDPGQAHQPSWTTIPVYAPTAGTINRLMPEWAGTQVWIQPTTAPTFTVRIFHVLVASSLHEGDRVAAGGPLGTHASDETMSDVAVEAALPSGGRRLVSYFDVMDAATFQAYSARGLADPSTAIISRAARDADPLTCNGDTFVNHGQLDDWLTLRGGTPTLLPALGLSRATLAGFARP
jgi:hypothetical protein